MTSGLPAGVFKPLTAYQHVFWDFDGVIKESVYAKSLAFVKLFPNVDQRIIQRIIQHHQENGGVSRFVKIPLYLDWTGSCVTACETQRLSLVFSDLVKQLVIDSPWVKGVYDYLESFFNTQSFSLISATPQNEIEYILSELSIDHFFRHIIGAPTPKSQAVFDIVSRSSLLREDCVFVGDSSSDLDAATINGIDFVLRKTDFNNSLQTSYSGLQLENFL